VARDQPNNRAWRPNGHTPLGRCAAQNDSIDGWDLHRWSGTRAHDADLALISAGWL
jgi:hypothetical protein